MSNRPIPPKSFVAQLSIVANAIGERPLDKSLEDALEAEFPVGGEWFKTTSQICAQGVNEGWLCGREAGGIKFGRAVPAGPEMSGYSIDVVEMENVVGPHHSHPNGEIDLIMPLTGAAEFDGKGAGWKVYGPGTAHRPTVAGGKALVLYLLPEGSIEFTR